MPLPVAAAPALRFDEDDLEMAVAGDDAFEFNADEFDDFAALASVEEKNSCPAASTTTVLTAG